MIVQNESFGDSPIQFESKKEPHYFSYLYILYALYSAAYFYWRIRFTLQWNSWFSPILLVSDAYLIVTSLFFLYTSRTIFVPRFIPSSKVSGDPTVDIFIPTYNEPEEIVRMTALAAQRVLGKTSVYILDDGNRPEIQKLAKDLSVRYLARTTNEHAKAGNLNNALTYATGDFILSLDCDHIPHSTMVERLLGYFIDEKLAFVQTPQTFYNLNSIQHRDTRYPQWNEQSMFYDAIQPAKNRFNAAFFCGSGALIRREALDSVGGFATGTATEDIHTSLRLHARGWRSLFVPERLAYGLAAEDLMEYHRQRVRWGAGSLGLLLRSPDSPLRARGLTFIQRCCYVYSTLAYVFGIQKFFYFLAPIATLFFFKGLSPSLVRSYFLLYSIHITLSYLVVWRYARGTFRIPYTEQYDIMNIFGHFEALKGVIRIQKKFGVSIKIKSAYENCYVYYALVMTAAFLLVANVALVTHAFVVGKYSLSGFVGSTHFIASIWNVYNLLFLGSTLYFLTRYNLSKRVTSRFLVRRAISLPDGRDAVLHSGSLKEAYLETKESLDTQGLLMVENEFLPWKRISKKRIGKRYLTRVAFPETMSYSSQSALLQMMIGAVHESFMPDQSPKTSSAHTFAFRFTSLL